MLYKIWARFLTIFGDLYFATKPPKVRAKQIREAINIVKKGDVICRKYIYYLDSYFIKGKYSHSGIVTNDSYCFQNMIHSIAEGVCNIDMIDFIKDCDGFIILRPKYENKQLLSEALIAAINCIGEQYDFLFDKKDKNAFYCHEFTSHCLKRAGIEINSNGIIYADDIIKQCDIVFEA